MALLRHLYVAALALCGCTLLTDSETLRFPSDSSDSSSTDALPPDSTTPDSISGDTADVPERRLVVRHSGESGCTLEYRSLLNCPTACAWTLVVDASESVGYGAFAWRFSATNSYRVSPSAASGARVTLTLDTPECGLTPPTVGPGKVIAEVSADGGGYAIAASIDFAVQQVSSCGDDDLCPAP